MPDKYHVPVVIFFIKFGEKRGTLFSRSQLPSLVETKQLD